jgi:hypothetical protein
MSLKGGCHELEVTPNLELLVTFGISLRKFVISLIQNYTTTSNQIWRELVVTMNKAASKLGLRKL